MNLFLRAKHWQLFLATFGIPMLVQIVVMANMMSSLMHKQNPAAMGLYFSLFPVIMIIFAGTLMGWMWSVAIGLQKLVPPNVKMKVMKFKIFFFIPLVYIALISIFFIFAIDGHVMNNDQPGVMFFSSFAIIVPIHLFAMFCMFYSLYFVAKTFKTVELQRAVNFSDFLGDFFMIWFFPIGIWVIQPKINKMVNT